MIFKGKNRRFTDEEVAFLQAHSSHPRKWLAQKIGATTEQVQSKILYLRKKEAGIRSKRSEPYPRETMVSPNNQLLSQLWKGQVTIVWEGAA